MEIEEIISTVELCNHRLAGIMEQKNRVLNGVLVSCTEAARLLGLSKKTITSMVQDGRLHRVTIENSTGIRLAEIYNSPKFRLRRTDNAEA